MAQNDDTQGYEENFSSILDLDRILDAIGQGKPIPQTESFDANDPVFAELANAREDLYRDIPPAPDMSHLVADDGNVAYGDFGAQEESGGVHRGEFSFPACWCKGRGGRGAFCHQHAHCRWRSCRSCRGWTGVRGVLQLARSAHQS